MKGKFNVYAFLEKCKLFGFTWPQQTEVIRFLVKQANNPDVDITIAQEKVKSYCDKHKSFAKEYRDILCMPSTLLCLANDIYTIDDFIDHNNPQYLGAVNELLQTYGLKLDQKQIVECVNTLCLLFSLYSPAAMNIKFSSEENIYLSAIVTYIQGLNNTHVSPLHLEATLLKLSVNDKQDPYDLLAKIRKKRKGGLQDLLSILAKYNQVGYINNIINCDDYEVLFAIQENVSLLLSIAYHKDKLIWAQTLNCRAADKVLAQLSANDSILFAAIADKKTQWLKWFVAEIPQAVNCVTLEGDNLLLYACMHQAFKAVKNILNTEPSILGDLIKRANNNGKTVLLLAAELGLGNVVSFALDYDCFLLGQTDKFKNTALHIAIRFNKVAVAAQLLSYYKSKPELNKLLTQVNSRGETALLLAAENGMANICKLIIEMCPQTATIVDNSGFSPLLVMITNRHYDCVLSMQKIPDETKSHILAENQKFLCEVIINKQNFIVIFNILKVFPEFEDIFLQYSYKIIHKACYDMPQGDHLLFNFLSHFYKQKLDEWLQHDIQLDDKLFVWMCNNPAIALQVFANVGDIFLHIEKLKLMIFVHQHTPQIIGFLTLIIENKQFMQKLFAVDKDCFFQARILEAALANDDFFDHLLKKIPQQLLLMRDQRGVNILGLLSYTDMVSFTYFFAKNMIDYPEYLQQIHKYPCGDIFFNKMLVSVLGNKGFFDLCTEHYSDLFKLKNIDNHNSLFLLVINKGNFAWVNPLINKLMSRNLSVEDKNQFIVANNKGLSPFVLSVMRDFTPIAKMLIDWHPDIISMYATSFGNGFCAVIHKSNKYLLKYIVDNFSQHASKASKITIDKYDTPLSVMCKKDLFEYVPQIFAFYPEAICQQDSSEINPLMYLILKNAHKNLQSLTEMQNNSYLQAAAIQRCQDKNNPFFGLVAVMVVLKQIFAYLARSSDNISSYQDFSYTDVLTTLKLVIKLNPKALLECDMHNNNVIASVIYKVAKHNVALNDIQPVVDILCEHPDVVQQALVFSNNYGVCPANELAKIQHKFELPKRTSLFF